MQDIHFHRGMQAFVGSREFGHEHITRQHNAIFTQPSIVQGHHDGQRTGWLQEFEPRLIGGRIILPRDDLRAALHLDIARHGHL